MVPESHGPPSLAVFLGAFGGRFHLRRHRHRRAAWSQKLVRGTALTLGGQLAIRFAGCSALLSVSGTVPRVLLGASGSSDHRLQTGRHASSLAPSWQEVVQASRWFIQRLCPRRCGHTIASPASVGMAVYIAACTSFWHRAGAGTDPAALEHQRLWPDGRRSPRPAGLCSRQTVLRRSDLKATNSMVPINRLPWFCMATTRWAQTRDAALLATHPALMSSASLKRPMWRSHGLDAVNWIGTGAGRSRYGLGYCTTASQVRDGAANGAKIPGGS